jgi:hypothetical protein
MDAVPWHSNLLRAAMLGIAILSASCQPIPQSVPTRDEAATASRSVDSLPVADEDYFKAMDGALSLTSDEVKGRNTWIIWTGGNDRFWDSVTNYTFGSFDLLKILSSYPDLKFSRDSRWHYLGLVNEPCFHKAKGPDPNRYGLWLDRRSDDCAPDPFDNAQKYPGVAIGARGRTVPVGSLYGAPSGIMGLRLFPNPAFDEAAARRWDPVRYYTDPAYYNSKDLVRPYRVGMSCGFCHIGPNPDLPPTDAEHPRFENLSSLVGAQYFWVDRIFNWRSDESNYLFQVLHTSRPGSLDTSLVATDYINNPRTMNAVYNVWPRLDAARSWGRETLAGGELNNRQFNDYVQQGPLTQFFQPPSTVFTPHVLKDGSDSVGTLGALNRVYVNIGLFSEEWTQHFIPLIGGKRQTPIEIADMRANSNYWGATEARTVDMALFLLKAGYPHKLADAPGGRRYLSGDTSTLNRGKIVFAESCASCHSSKHPEIPAGADPGACIGPGYLACWDKYWSWTQSDPFKQQMRQIVVADDFLKDNYLSTDMRVPVTLLQTNACSPLASNSLQGEVWSDFSSESYKSLPSVGTITVYDPFTGEPQPFTVPAGGRGYTRVPSLISLWSTAPFLLNNSVGPFNPEPSVAARMSSFNASITQMLWPAQRASDPVFGNHIPGVIDRTTASSYLRIPAGYLPEFVRKSEPIASLIVPSLFDGQGGIEVGPIPKGAPVDLIANLDLLPEGGGRQRLMHDADVVQLLARLIHDLKTLPAGATDEQAMQVFANVARPLYALSRCPDYVVNRGHYFGSELSDEDKRALIAFVKTF